MTSLAQVAGAESIYTRRTEKRTFSVDNADRRLTGVMIMNNEKVKNWKHTMAKITAAIVYMTQVDAIMVWLAMGVIQ